MNTMVVKIIWGALTLSQLMYGVICVVLFSEPGTPSTLPLWIPAITTALVSIFIFTTRLSHLNLQTLFRANPPRVAYARALPLYIICWALNESVALFGFVVTFTGDHLITTFAPYLLAGVALNVLMFPRLDRHMLEAEARKIASGEQG